MDLLPHPLAVMSDSLFLPLLLQIVRNSLVTNDGWLPPLGSRITGEDAVQAVRRQCNHRTPLGVLLKSQKLSLKRPDADYDHRTLFSGVTVVVLPRHFWSHQAPRDSARTMSTALQSNHQGACPEACLSCVIIRRTICSGDPWLLRRAQTNTST